MRRLIPWFLAWTIGSTAMAAVPVSRGSTCDELLANAWLRDVVISNLNQLADFPGSWALASQQIVHGIIAEFKVPALDFVYFERFFRREGIPLYLVANTYPLERGLTIGYTPAMAKLKGGAVPKYHLWTGVNGPEEAAAFKARLGISDEENLKRLAETGFIFVLDEASLATNANMDVADDETIRDVANIPVRRSFDPDDN